MGKIAVYHDKSPIPSEDADTPFTLDSILCKTANKLTNVTIHGLSQGLPTTIANYLSMNPPHPCNILEETGNPGTSDTTL